MPRTTTRFQVTILLFLSLLQSAASAQTDTDDNTLADDDQSYPCALKGLTEGAITIYPTEPDSVGGENPEVCLYNKRKKVSCVTTTGAINTSGPAVTCKGQTIEIFSMQDAMATTLRVMFDGKNLNQNKKKAAPIDLNAATDKAFEKALKRGDIKGAISALDTKLYPRQSLSIDDACSGLMLSAHKSAQPSIRKKDWATAAASIEPAWSWCESKYKGKLPDSFGKQPNFILALNDYGFVLAETKQFAVAEPILRQVLSLDKERTAAYLNLADTLVGQKKNAGDAYDEYCQRTPKAKWPKRVAGVSSRCKK